MAAIIAAGRAATACHAWFSRALHAGALKLRRNHRYFSGGGSSSSPSSNTASSWPVLAALLCAATAALCFPRAVAFFLPLVASTSAFCATTAAYLSATSSDPERGAAKEVVLVRGVGEPAEAGTLQVYADANASAYGDRSTSSGCGFQVGCFLRKSAKRGVDEDGEDVVLAGRLLVPAPGAAAGALEEELVSLQVDRMAEGVWDSYFGRWSTWNHYAASDDGCDD